MVSVSESSQTNAGVVIAVRRFGIGWKLPDVLEWHAYIERGFRHAYRRFQSWEPTDLFFFVSHDRLPTSYLYPQLLVIIPPVPSPIRLHDATLTAISTSLFLKGVENHIEA